MCAFTRLASVVALAATIPVGIHAQARTERPVDPYTSRARDEIVSLERAWCRAGERGDTATVARILAPDYTGQTSRGQTTTKADEIRSATRSPSSPPSSCGYVDPVVRVYGNAAVVTSRVVYGGVRNGVPFTNRIVLATDTYVKRNGRWQCVASAVTLVAEQQGS